MSSEQKAYEIVETFSIEDLETLKILTHPQRIEILHTLQQPKTVKSIAAAIEADPTKLYYHIKKMEKIGAIQVVETNIVSGIVEKKYLVTAHNYQVDENLFTGDEPVESEVEFPNMVEAVFKSTIKQAKRSAKAGLIDMKKPREGHKLSVSLSSLVLYMDDARLEEFGSRMQALMDDFGHKPAEDGTLEGELNDYIFTLAFFPRPNEDEPG